MELEKMGWRVVVIWECETNYPEQLERTLKAILQGL
jgi:G:T-mismatch repair DNA endonuclease (very short patch repair protein)